LGENDLDELITPVAQWDLHIYLKIGGKPPKWMVYTHGKPYEQMDDLGGKPHYFRKHPFTYT